MAELVDGPRPPGSPPIPGWDDILHVRPRYRPTRADYDELRAADREGRAPQLSDQAMRSIEQRAEMIARLRTTEVAGWRQQMVRVVTTLDNIQDQISTVAWITGPVINRIPRIGTFITGGMEATATGINYLQRLIAGPQPGLSAKNRRANSRRADARTRTGVLGALQRGLGWLQRNQGHLIEGAQATDTWFGVGLSLGAIFGALEETYWRTGRQAFYLAQTALNAAVLPLLLTTPEQQEALQEAAATSAARGIAVPLPPPIQVVDWLYERIRAGSAAPGGYSALTYGADAIAASHLLDDGDITLMALGNIRQATAGGPGLDAIAQHLSDDQIRDLTLPPPYVRDPVSRFLLERQGMTVDQHAAPTGEWRNPPMTLAEHVNVTLPEYVRSPRLWLPADTDTQRGQLIHQLVEANMPATASLLAGDAAGIRDQYSPEDQVLFHAIDQGAIPPRTATRSQLINWGAELLDARDRNPEAWTRGGFRRLSDDYWRRAARPAAAGG